MRPITDLRFDNTYARLPPACYHVVDPTPLPDPYVVSLNRSAASLLDLDLDATPSGDLASYLSGARRIPGAEPLAQAYAGHQFGVWVPQLGDGRAILLGEVRNARGEQWDLHLKGGGLTRFSRMGDGRAVLRSTIREYLCSEAMHALGIPTTRALSIVGSDAPVYREVPETAATLIRLAPTHVRFGTFQLFASRGQTELVKAVADQVIDEHFPEIAGREDRYPAFITAVSERTGALIAQWMAAGWAHGVMNTDNMSILGITLDYGPYGFLDAYEAGFICNHSDHEGRYAYNQQPGIGLWNVARLAEAFLGLITEEQAYAALDAYRPSFDSAFAECMRRKFGLTTVEADDGTLVARLFSLLQEHHPDYPRLFRALGAVETAEGATHAPIRRFFQEDAAFDVWLRDYVARLRREGSEDGTRRAAMARVNPAYVLRNWLAERAIRSAVDDRDYGEVDRLLGLVQDPFTERPGLEEYAEAPPPWGRDLVVSCSS